MPLPSEDRLKAALADRYVIQREIGQGGMAATPVASCHVLTWTQGQTRSARTSTSRPHPSLSRFGPAPPLPPDGAPRP